MRRRTSLLVLTSAFFSASVASAADFVELRDTTGASVAVNRDNIGAMTVEGSGLWIKGKDGSTMTYTFCKSYATSPDTARKENESIRSSILAGDKKIDLPKECFLRSSK